jgi:septal ring factor EnvC (AmiA/AmiB activator)
MNRPLSWRTPAAFALVLSALFLFSNSSAFSQTQEPTPQTPEVEQLKKRLQALEQTVVELKGQIDAIETKKKSSTPAIIEATYSEPATPADTASTAPAKPQDNNKGESTFQIYGFAMLDAGYQFKQNHPDWFDVIRPTKLTSFPNEFAPNGSWQPAVLSN